MKSIKIRLAGSGEKELQCNEHTIPYLPRKQQQRVAWVKTQGRASVKKQNTIARLCSLLFIPAWAIFAHVVSMDGNYLMAGQNANLLYAANFNILLSVGRGGHFNHAT